MKYIIKWLASNFNAQMPGPNAPQAKEIIMKSGGYVYIMSNHKMGTLYIGSTSDLIKRVWQHKTKYFPNCFTAKYGLNKLVYYEFYESLENMVKHERQMKEWQRNWKLKLIIQKNPNWNDLYNEFLGLNGIAPYEEWIFLFLKLNTCGALGPGLRRDDDVGRRDDEF